MKQYTMESTTYASGLLFTLAHKAVRTRIYEALEKYELNPSYWSILGITFNAPEGVRLATVARQMDVKAPLVTMLAGDLIEKGLITRVAHHSDGRAKLLVITAKGKKLAAQIETELRDEIGRLMEGVSPSDAAVFERTLKTILANAESE